MFCCIIEKPQLPAAGIDRAAALRSTIANGHTLESFDDQNFKNPRCENWHDCETSRGPGELHQETTCTAKRHPRRPWPACEGEQDRRCLDNAHQCLKRNHNIRHSRKANEVQPRLFQPRYAHEILTDCSIPQQWHSHFGPRGDEEQTFHFAQVAPCVSYLATLLRVFLLRSSESQADQA
jgi:hypothetical protein